ILVLGNSSAASNQTVTSLSSGGTGTNSQIQGANTTVFSTLTINSSTTGTYSGVLGNGTAGASGANELALVLNGGTLALTGNNTYRGTTTITKGGDLQINSNTSLGTNDSTSATAVTIGNGTATGATLEVTANLTANREIIFSGNNDSVTVDTNVVFTD